MGEPFIVCDNLVKIYKVADLEVVALQGLDLTVNRGELMAIIGNSGSGKSTLLNILGGLDRPSAGRVSVGNRDLLKMDDRNMVLYKREVVGFVWQQSSRNLIPYLTALENVQVPMIIAGKSADEQRSWAGELLDAVGLGHRKTHRLSQLSGGEQQRVAIAIGLANHPPLLLADEPTGEVDTATAGVIYGIFRRLNEEYGTTVVIVSHDPAIAFRVDRVVAIRDGRTSTETVRRTSVEGEEAGEQTHEEFVVMDGAGRIQIPRDYVEKLGMGRRVRVDMEDDRIVVRSADDAPAAPGENGTTGNGATTSLAGAAAESTTSPSGTGNKPRRRAISLPWKGKKKGGS
ncbi:MAG: ABC transporter ATP-binding protein [Chloroflexota bacterium]|nr:ABC transporter ATP-binding protein [Chloroflexota bacterium]